MVGQRSCGAAMGLPPCRRGIFPLEGEFWTITFGAGLCRLRDSAGLRYLAALLRRPGLKVLAADLVVLAGRAAEGLDPPDRELARSSVTSDPGRSGDRS
jgi:hypothetical protein